MLRILSVKAVVCLRLTLLLLIGLSRSVSADQPAALSVEEFKKQCIDTQIELLPQDFSKKVSDPAKFDSKKAILSFEKFKDQDFDVNVYKVMSYNYFLERRFKEADSVFQRLELKVTSDVDKFWVYYNGGIVLISQAFIFKSSEKYVELQKLVNQALAIGLNLSIVLVADFIFAGAKFQKAFEVNPNSAEAHYYCGIADIGIGKYKNAIEQFKKAIEIDSNFEDAYSQWGRVLGNTGKYQEAIEKYQKALKINPKNCINYSNWGTALIRLDMYEEATEKYQKAVETDSTNTFVYSNWAEALFNLEKYDQATEKCNKAIGIYPKNPDAYYVLAQIHTKLNLKQEALTYLLKACELNQQLKTIARNDKDFKKIWGDPEFRKITKP